MPLYPYRGKRPTIAPDAWVAPTATLIGDVTLESGASVWFGTTIRADMAPVRIGRNSDVQDNCVIHVDEGEPTILGANVTMGHGAIVHSSIVEDEVLIANAAVLIGANRVGTGTIVGSGAVVPEGTSVPAGVVLLGIPAKVARASTEADRERIRRIAEHYADLSRQYRESGL